jgi:PDZ domain
MNATIVRNVIFPIFALVHTIAWQTCKSQENDGTCSQLFGRSTTSSTPDAEFVRLAPHPPFWKRLFVGGAPPLLKTLQQELLEKQDHEQHVRLELIRELNLALAILCAMAIFTSPETLRTQLLFMESIVCGLGTWDAIQRSPGPAAMVVPIPYLTLALLSLALIATIGLFLQVSPDVLDSLPLPVDDDRATKTTRDQFDKLPDDVEELMHESVEAVAVESMSQSDQSTRLLLPGEEQAGVIMASVTKPYPDAIVGISLRKVVGSWRIVVTHLTPTGLFSSTPLQVGQTILSINGITITELFTVRDAIAIIKDAKEQVNIVATQSIFVQVKPASPDMEWGFSLALSPSTNHTIIHNIQNGPVLAGTAVQEGMRVLAINNLPCPKSPGQVAEWVKTTKSSLTLLVIPTVEPEPHDDATTAATTLMSMSLPYMGAAS